jgi:hypothetical protein
MLGWKTPPPDMEGVITSSRGLPINSLPKRTQFIMKCSYGYETYSLILREEYRLMVFDSNVLRRIFGRKRDEIIRIWRKFPSWSFITCILRQGNLISRLESSFLLPFSIPMSQIHVTMSVLPNFIEFIVHHSLVFRVVPQVAGEL